MALAAIYDSWVNKDTGEVINGFSIITTAPNKVTAAIGHHRSPVILYAGQYSSWLHSKHLSEITPMLNPYDRDDLNAFPVSPEIKSPRVDDETLLKPIGNAIFKNITVKFKTEFDTQGFGRRKKL